MATPPNTNAHLDLAHCGRIADAQPHPLLFVTVSGNHLYGFASPTPTNDPLLRVRGVA